MALIGFARVSTLEQDLTEQVNALKEVGCETIFQGKNSGKRESNEERLAELKGYVREGDVVVVTKLDRLGRSVIQILNVLDFFKSKGVQLKTLDGVIDPDKEDNILNGALIQLVSMFAEIERKLIVTRTMEGKRAKGMLQGRPEALNAEQYKQFAKDVKAGASLSELQKKYSIGRATVSRWKKRVLGIS